MRFLQVIWDDDDRPDGNVQHIAEHGLTIEDVEHVLENPTEEGTSGSTGRPGCFGYTPGGESGTRKSHQRWGRSPGASAAGDRKARKS